MIFSVQHGVFFLNFRMCLPVLIVDVLTLQLAIMLHDKQKGVNSDLPRLF